MNTFKNYCIVLLALVVITGCKPPENSHENSHIKNFTSKYPDMPALEQPAVVLAGEYEGEAAMRMDESRPLNNYPGTFTVTSNNDTDSVMLSASIKPGKMPFPVNYTFKDATQLKYSKEGYLINGSFKVDVTLNSGTKKEMPEFDFTLNERSRLYVDNDGQYWLELYYPDQKMASGKILPGICFFKGKKK
ncbi:hypothetical protein [Treponema phagedenis]|uniref:hypothetical protein n=1 Tax=Treponema phagedenis TaxID=162 RepID=UPI0001F63834|nr:hypothetical protein [Treponema phagedenis]EFW36669.1 hypothetical protein HMPREF9554_02784 [Treponema phagedenis F0421]TYT79017.1 hypothetical protein FS559_07790 [Treponema phagedenis]